MTALTRWNPFAVLAKAREELFDGALEYERKESGLGVRFRNEGGVRPEQLNVES